MAETDVLYEFGREPGFSCSSFWPWMFSYVTHGGSTEMSVECLTIERHKIVQIV